VIIEAEDELPKFVRSRSFIFAVLAATATLAVIWIGIAHFLLSLSIAFAEEQVSIFDGCLETALKSEPSKAVAQLHYVRDYYTSGSKQTAGSPLDRVVESHRAGVMREIIAHLRLKTGVDLGNDPQAWIDRFGKP
jgi:hypothetical protein